MSDLTVNLSMGLIKTGVFLFDIISYPFYAIYQRPWKKQRLNGEKKSKEIGAQDGVRYRSVSPLTDMQINLHRKGINTLDKAFEHALNQFPDERCVGTRKAINEYSEVQSNGKVFKKLELGEYEWLTYRETNEKALNFGRGLRILGYQPRENILIFAETRAEWFISALGAFKQNIPVCTLYSTLGEESIIHGINETETRIIITSHELFPKVKQVLKHCPKVQHIVYFPEQLQKTDTSGCEGVTIFSWEDIIKKGSLNSISVCQPSPDDIAVVMYTSGSTGVPKGVVITHNNLVSAMIAYTGIIQRKPNDAFLAYLPLAHVLELIAELTMNLVGIPLGYSSPLTMTDRSTKIKRGCQGDVTVLKPTLMTAVPLILDRIYKGILEKVAAQGPFLKALFDFGVKYRMKWSESGWDTPFCNWFVFRKIRALLGGHIRIIATGGAPLNSDTHKFIKSALGCPVLQGYGLTETCGCAAVMNGNDVTTGRVGGPLPICDIKLINWEEGNYRTSDLPNPRGEICIGGGNVTVGYLKNEKKTKEDFEDDSDGRRWFKTGDIGEFQADGSLKIIDRKKDLVKLQIGEYVSLGKVEAELKVSPLIDNICVYGESSKNNIVAIVSPNKEKIEELATSMNKDPSNLEQLCLDHDIINHVLDELISIGKRVKLEKFEFPTAVYLTSELWTPDSGLVTAAFKLKRKQIQTKYQREINRMYGRHGG